jgi:hypothetical protein
MSVWGWPAGCNAKARTCARFCFQKIDLLSTFLHGALHRLPIIISATLFASLSVLRPRLPFFSFFFFFF